MEIKKHISFSEYRLYASCPFKHYLEKYLGYNQGTNEFLVFGTSIHAVIEDIVNKKYGFILYESLLKKHLEANGSAAFTSSYFGKKMIPEGVAILKELNFFKRYEEYEIIGSEIEMYEPLCISENREMNFKGIIDLVLKKGDEYLIIDFKTAMQPWNIDKKKEDKTFFGQLALYKHFYATKHGIPLDKIKTRFVALARTPIDVQQYEINISDEFMDFMLTDLKRVAKEIGSIPQPYLPKAKHMIPVNKLTCTYCQLKEICDDNKIQEIQLKQEIIKLEK
jgi:CRISPR/Cas system-associated exonuclease Cas4 (RecB family)